jgi:hypothetical protein
MTTISAALHCQLAEAIEAIPTTHLNAPVAGEAVADPDAFYIRLQDWAFSQGYAFVKSSGKNEVRRRFKCFHHQAVTRNTRKLEEKDRRRVATHVREGNCKFECYISVWKTRGDQWVFNYTHTIHNHPPAVDPFQLEPHHHRRPGHAQAIEVGKLLRGSVGYSVALEVMSKEDLYLGRKEFYNL